jgi:hypothetical protein
MCLAGITFDEALCIVMKTKNTKINSKSEKGTKVMRALRRIFIILGLTLIAFAYWLMHEAQKSGQVYQPATNIGLQDTRPGKIRGNVESNLRPIYVEASKKINSVGSDAEREIGQAITIFERDVSKIVPRISEQLSGVKNSTALVKDLVIDRVKGTDYTGERIDGVLRAELVRPAKKLEHELAEILDLQVDRSTMHSQEMVASMTSGYQFAPAGIVVPQVRQEMVGAVKANILGKASATVATTGVGLVLEGILLKPTINAIRNLALRIFSRPIATASVSAVAPAADGPLPIGDAIAVVGLTWTAIDIAVTNKKMKKESRLVVEEAVAEMVRDVRRRAVAVARAQRDGANENLELVFGKIVQEYVAVNQ